MTEPTLIPADDSTESERTTLLIAYILHGLGVFNGLTAVAGVIINHLKVNETRSLFISSHHRWLIRSFWWALLWVVVSWALSFVLVGLIGFVIVAVWWIYRIVRGALSFSERRPMPV